MRSFTIPTLSLLLLIGTSQARAADDVLNCQSKSLADAVSSGKDKNQTINFTGTCSGPIVIQTDGMTLNGVGTAIIEGGGQDAVTVNGASRVALTNFEIRNGMSGIVAVNGAHVTLSGVNSHDNSDFGITIQTGSSAVLSNVSVGNNGLHGLDVQTGSAASVSGSLAAESNRVFGINVNGSSINFTKATVAANGNALGIQIATSSNAFLNDSTTTINANSNLATGLTVVSGAHMVSFGGTINASGNPVNGVSVNSKGGLDLDAAAVLNSFNNGDGLVVQEGSVMTVFNNPTFSGVPGFSTVNVHNNTATGMKVQTDSTVTLSNQARVISNTNATGLIGDNAAGLNLINSIITGNTTKDIQLTFGTTADLRTITFGTYTCDATVLVRGTSGIICPH